MKRNVFFATVLTFILLFSAEAYSSEWGSIKPDRAHMLLKESGGVWLVDIRNPGAFSAGHIEGSLNIPSELIKIKQFQKGKRLILVDDSIGQISSKKIAQLLSAKGIQISVLDGGIRQWVRDGLPLTDELPGIGIVTPLELREAFDAKIHLNILDLRTEDEFRAGSLPGAKLISGVDISERIMTFKRMLEKQNAAGQIHTERGSSIILILPKGQDIQQLEQNLKADSGEVKYLVGGMEAWAASFGARERKTVGSCPYCTTKTQINR